MNRRDAEAQRRVFLGLGTNVGDREGNLREAIARLKRAPGVNFLRQSRVYQTEPIGVTDQPEFLNMVVEVEVADSVSARDLLALVKQIETQVGRRQRERWGPREIDIDVLLFGDERIVEDDLEVPHPHMWERAFVMAPLAELAPDMKTPSGETVAEVARRLRRRQKVRAVRRWWQTAWDLLAVLPLVLILGCQTADTYLDAMMGPFALQWELTFICYFMMAAVLWLGYLLALAVMYVTRLFRSLPGLAAADGRKLLVLVATPVVFMVWSAVGGSVLSPFLPDHGGGGFRRKITRRADLGKLQEDSIRMIEAQDRVGTELELTASKLGAHSEVPASIRRLEPQWLVVVPAQGPKPGYVDISWMPGIFYICGLRVGPPEFTPGPSEEYEKWGPGIYAYERDED